MHNLAIFIPAALARSVREASEAVVEAVGHEDPLCGVAGGGEKGRSEAVLGGGETRSRPRFQVVKGGRAGTQKARHGIRTPSFRAGTEVSGRNR